MIHDVIMPQLSMGMSEGTIVEWAVKGGEFLEKNTLLVSIETEKVVTDLPSPYRGFVRLIAEVGETLQVETRIAQIADTLAELEQDAASSVTPSAPTARSMDVPVVEGTEVGGSSRAATSPITRIRASGLAKKIASDAEIDLSSISGSGPLGRIVRRDVAAIIDKNALPPPEATVTANGSSTLRERVRIPMAGARRTIAERMVKSKTTAAHTYAFFEVDLSKLNAVRQTLLSREQELKARVSLTALYAKALAVACRHVPICNSTLSDNVITVWDNVNIGIAVALPGKTEFESSLVVPVARDAERKGVLELDRDIRNLIEMARSGTLSPGATADGTVTLSSSAGFVPGNWMVSTPLLNQPQVVNFQPGSPIDKPVAIDGQVVIRTILPCSLSFDHRAMDGEPMGRFIRKLADVLANPELMLV